MINKFKPFHMWYDVGTDKWIINHYPDCFEIKKRKIFTEEDAPMLEIKNVIMVKKLPIEVIDKFINKVTEIVNEFINDEKNLKKKINGMSMYDYVKGWVMNLKFFANELEHYIDLPESEVEKVRKHIYEIVEKLLNKIEKFYETIRERSRHDLFMRAVEFIKSLEPYVRYEIDYEKRIIKVKIGNRKYLSREKFEEIKNRIKYSGFGFNFNPKEKVWITQL